ncbi:hypothetical protein AB0K47_27210, partial [Streptomyces tirandamycinicus]|uniref:hypothetical protein n=1 Tax=Streptomyces tirandamycinicus TaxID=2174846 RepID=UPI00342DF6FC
RCRREDGGVAETQEGPAYKRLADELRAGRRTARAACVSWPRGIDAGGPVGGGFPPVPAHGS